MNQSSKCAITLGVLFLVIGVAWGCGSDRVVQSKGQQNDSIKHHTGSAAMGEAITVDELVNNATQYENQLLTIRGVFMGWKGSCSVPPPETRSDWMIEYNDKCIYVSGPTPLGIDRTPNSKDIGKTIDIHGSVLLNNSGTPYIKIIHQ